VGGGLALWLHFRVRRLSAEHILGRIARQFAPGNERNRLSSAFNWNTRPWVSLFRNRPAGWSEGTRRRLHRVVSEANQYVQILNDRYTDPSGEAAATSVPASTLKLVSSTEPERTPPTGTGRDVSGGADS